MIAAFVSCGFSGKQIPSYESVYPDSVTSPQNEDLRIAVIKEQLLDFATEANKRRHNTEAQI